VNCSPRTARHAPRAAHRAREPHTAQRTERTGDILDFIGAARGQDDNASPRSGGGRRLRDDDAKI